MSFIFISHASADKQARIRPLVEVLLAEGERVWVDRPGAGAGNLGFSEAEIERLKIDSLRVGAPWPTGIQQALTECGVVLGCISRESLQASEVLRDELTFANLAGKLLTCIVDDLPLSALADLTRGLLDLSNHQTPRIDCALLGQALVARAATGLRVDELPPSMLTEWEKVRGLLASARRIRPAPHALLPDDVARIREVLETIPVGPILKIHEVPTEIVSLLGEGFDSLQRTDAMLTQAATLLRAALPSGFTERQILLRRGELPPFGSLPPEDFWLQALAAAGLKGRRTVAAILLSPLCRRAAETSGVVRLLDEFVGSLGSGRPA